MARYKRGGVWRVNHVSTSSGDDDCKDAWEAIKAETTVTDITEFKPHQHATGNAKTWGLVTATGDFYAIGCEHFTLYVKDERTAEEIAAAIKSGEPEANLRWAKTQVGKKVKVNGLKVVDCVQAQPDT